ncbi:MULTISPECIES: tetraacyldisaccharide 4'-kinase, partial [Comamonas]
PAGTPADTPCFGLQRQLAPFALTRDGQRVPLAGLQGLRLHALAAIARPEDFFAMLRAQSLELAHTEALPDHYNFESWQRSSDLDLQVICTEKDAVKLWPHVPQALAVPLHLRIAPGYFDLLDARLCLSSTPLNTNR